MERKPVPITSIRFAATNITSIKKLDCACYNACLDTAYKGEWLGFSCQECQAFQAMDPDQRMSDFLAMHALMMASDNELEMGNSGRRRGVKPGADARGPRINQPVLDEPQEEATPPENSVVEVEECKTPTTEFSDSQKNDAPRRVRHKRVKHDKYAALDSVLDWLSLR